MDLRRNAERRKEVVGPRSGDTTGKGEKPNGRIEG
jgi:hypothetical protein